MFIAKDSKNSHWCGKRGIMIFNYMILKTKLNKTNTTLE